MKFTPEEDKFLFENYLTIPAKRMSKILGRSESGARQRMKLLGIEIPAELTESFKKAGQIKPGSIPPNKGKKQTDYMTPEAIARTAKTRFKKGNEPHNTKHDGYERITQDGYIEIRVRKGVFKLKHRLEWEKVNGPIPDGYILVCKGQDIKDTDPANWEPITMQENMNRNSGPLNLSDTMIATYLSKDSLKCDHELKKLVLTQPDLIQAKRTHLLLNRKIKSYGTK